MSEMKTVSLLVPTCKRSLLLKRFMASVWTMTFKKKNIDVHFIVDDNDPETQAYTKALVAEYGTQIACYMHIVTRKNTVETFNLNEDYYNMAARESKGDLVWVLADDLELLIPGWDEKVLQEANNFAVKFPDRAFCISLKDNTPPPSHRLPKFPCFPLFPREVLAAQGGWILHPKVPTWGCDYVAYCIFNPLERILELHKDCWINHISWHTKQVAVDSTNEWIGHVFNKMKHVPHSDTERIINQEVPVISGKILDYAKEWQRKKNEVNNQTN